MGKSSINGEIGEGMIIGEYAGQMAGVSTTQFNDFPCALILMGHKSFTTWNEAIDAIACDEI